MKKWATAVMASQLVVSTFAWAHGPTPQKVDEKIVINAPIEVVWDKVSDFGNIAEWHPMVESATMLEERARELTLTGKEGTITESLDEKDDAKHYMGYRLLTENIEVFPVSYYGITIQLDDVDEGTEMRWEGRFYRADTGNFPPEEYNDEAAVAAMTAFATSGMQALKVELEAGQ